jgi:hypothetical protein
VKPATDLTMEEAAESLTGWEVVAIEARLGRLDTLGVGQLLIATVWAFENRDGSVSWQAVGERSIGELNGYFAPEPEVEESKSDGGPTGTGP